MFRQRSRASNHDQLSNGNHWKVRSSINNSLLSNIFSIIAISFSSIIVSSSFPWWTPFLPIAAIGAFSTLSLVCLLPVSLYSNWDEEYKINFRRNLAIQRTRSVIYWMRSNCSECGFFMLSPSRRSNISRKSYIFLTASSILTAWYSKVGYENHSFQKKEIRNNFAGSLLLDGHFRAEYMELSSGSILRSTVSCVSYWLASPIS